MFRRVLFFVAGIACLAGSATAQTQPCSTDEHHAELVKQYPQIAEYEQQFNKQLAARFASKTTGEAPDTNTYDIPLVVHIVHDYGIENVSDDAIYEAVANWARAFVKQNADTASVIAPFVPYIGDAKIRLHLATIDPDGNPTKGVLRHYSYLTRNGDDESKYSTWPHDRYINIWFTSTLGSSTAAAYAYYPAAGATRPFYDGVIGLASYLNYSKTIPHELGHVLNLAHVWGNTNSAGDACGNDGVDDTPPTKGHTPGCVLSAIYDTACATGYAKMYTSMSGLVDSLVDYPDTVNAQNIMDYTYCANMFTKGQCVRMRKALTSSVAGRSNLITPANIAATGALAPMPDLPPVADFIVARGSGVGAFTDLRSYFLTFNNAVSFAFKNASWNDTISSVRWQFSNGPDSAISTSATTVVNRFAMPGWVTVTLTATSNAGSNSKINTHAVYAADTAIAGGLGYSQPFAMEGDIPNWPMINYYENQFKWEFFNGAGKDDNSCIRYRSFDSSEKIVGTANGDFDDIVTPAFNLAGVTGDLYVNFYTAGMVTSGSSGASRDSLELQVSTSGGVRWTKIAGFKGTELANNGIKSSEFVPTAATAWKGRSVSITSDFRSSQTFFRLRFRPGNIGNNLYVDNFSISSLPSEVQDLASNSSNSLLIYPNPSSAGSNLVFRSGSDGKVSYSVRDITGKLVFEASKTVLPNTAVQEFIPRSALPSAGMYIVTLTAGGATNTAKMVVY
jgi:PKD repeat protein